MRGSRASAGLERPTLGHHGERLGVDVGLQEAVEQHQPVRAGLVQPQRHLAGRAEVRAQLDRHRHADRVLDPRQDVDVALLDVAARDVRVAGQVVDVQLDRGGAGVLHRPRVVGPAAGRDAVEAGDHRDVDGGGGALEQAQVAPWARPRPRRRPGSRTATRRSSRCRRRPAARSRPPRGAAAPRRASTARPRRRRRRRAAGRRRRSARAATPTRRAGCAARGPGSGSTGPSAVLAGVGGEVLRRRGSPSPRRRPSAGRPPAGPARAAARPRPGRCCASVR